MGKSDENGEQMSRVVTMGEMMIRLMPPNNLRFEQASCFDAFYGGDESIVAVSLSRLGIDTSYVTKLPKNVFGDIAVSQLRMHGVHTGFIARGGDRMGLNFYENGAAMRPSKVIYDRAHSAISEAVQEDFDFEAIFSGARWFHVSGITPALSDAMERITETALRTAKEKDVMVSFDLNYRRKLWSQEKARKVVSRLMKYVDVCIGNEEDTEITLGFSPSGTNVLKGELNIEGYREMFLRMKERYGFKYIASTLRESRSASDNGWSVILYDGKDFCVSRKYDIHLVDRGGGGAAFSAGLIYSILKQMSLRDAAEFAGAASALKQTVMGDFNLVTLEEIESVIRGDTSGRVQR
jgi:2-dehydro-3-deoxygluconokinase